MSRKRRHSGTTTVLGTPRRSIHRRRRRAIRHQRTSVIISNLPRIAIAAVAPKRPLLDAQAAAFVACAVLIGAAFSMLCAGVYLSAGMFDSAMPAHARARELVPIAIMISCACGVMAMRRLSRFAIPTSAGSYQALSTIGLLGGLAVVMEPFLLDGAGKACQFLFDHFMLSDWLLRLFQVVAVIVACFIPCVLTVWTGHALHWLPRGPEIRKSTHCGAMSAGLAAGASVALLLEPNAHAILSIASLPLFLIALISVKLSPARQS